MGLIPFLLFVLGENLSVVPILIPGVASHNGDGGCPCCRSSSLRVRVVLSDIDSRMNENIDGLIQAKNQGLFQ